ncbi:MAG: alkaline phosphatase family protein [Pseudomonadota bacterium]
MTKTLLIGLDGATFTVLDPLMNGDTEEGVVMPFLAEMVKTGYSATLASTNHPLTPPAWTSVITGRTPGHHGVFDFMRFEDLGDDVYFTLFDSRDIRAETLWRMAGRQGKTVASLNFPMMAPPQEIEGSLVPGFVSWKHLRRNMHPKSLFARIDGIEGFDPKALSWDFEREDQIGEAMEEGELYRWVEPHLARDRQWFNIAKFLLEEDEPDLLALMLDGTDKIQHQAWHILDPALWTPEASDLAKDVRRLTLRYFRELDGYLRALREAAGPEARMIIVSDHGFTGAPDVLRINLFLEELGLLHWNSGDGSDTAKRREMANFANLDWTRTQAFCPTPSSNGIVIRRKSEACPNGVDPSDYEVFRERLIEDLLGLRHPETGAPVIAKVMKREDAFPGRAMEMAPDLTLMLADHGFVSVRNRPPVVAKHSKPIGTHHPDGIFVMTGPGVEAKRGARMSIVDTTAVVLHSMGLPVPSDLEGVVPADLNAPAWLASHPVEEGPATLPVDARGAGADEASNGAKEAQKKEMLAQLKLLGYLED